MQNSKYFKGKELVSPEVYKIYGEEAIKFDVTLAKGYIHVDNMETGKNGIYIFKP